jgi:hypothetical protein
VRVLVACEFSGVVRRAFRARGHDAWSCDLLPAEDRDPHHVQGDVLALIDQDWDLIIAHPPCTYLANSGVRWLYGGRGAVRDAGRWAAMEKAAAFVRRIREARAKRICVENPVMHGHGRALSGFVPAQVVQPWMFGHGEIKAICLDLKGLEPLVPTRVVSGRRPRVHFASPSPDRWKERSRTLPGVGDAMAERWSAPSI